MPTKFLKKHWQRIWVSTVGISLFVVCVIGVAINFYFSPKLDHKLKATILSSTDSLYTLNFSKVNLHIFQGKIIIDNIVLQPNLSVYNRKKKLNLAPNSLYEVKIKHLSINHVHPFTLYFKKKVDIDQLVISEPDIQVSYEQNRNQDTVLKDKKTPYQLISKVLKSIHIQNILLNDVKLKYVDHSGKKPDVSEFKELNLNATDFLLDSLSQFSKTRFLFCSDVSAELNNYNGTSFDRRYRYEIKKIRFSTRSSELNVTDFSFLPNEKAFAFFKTTNADYWSFKLDSFKLSNFDFKTYSKYHKLFASRLTLANGSMRLFSNPSTADTTRDHSVNYPQLLLKRLRIDLKIDTVHVKNIAIFFTEYSKKSNHSGTASFDNTTGYIYNITNNKGALKQNTYATAKLQTYFLKTGKLDVDFNFKLNDENLPFSFKGSMGAMDLQKITPLTAPLALVSISSGKMKRLDFDYHLNRTTAKGKLCVLYNDLRVSILKRDSTDNSLKKMGIVSFLANALVIKRDNPAQQEPPRIASVLLLRVKQWEMFTYIWRAMMTGLKECGGYDRQTEQTVKQKVKEYKDNKPERMARKAERQQRRAERRARKALKKQQKEADEEMKGNEKNNDN